MTTERWYEIKSDEWARTTEEDWDSRLGNSVVLNAGNFKYICLVGTQDSSFLGGNGARPIGASEVAGVFGLQLDVHAVVQSQFAETQAVGTGLGDRLAALFQLLGFRRSCNGCNRRRHFLNRFRVPRT